MSTHYQTNFRLFQTERVCSRQFQIWWKWKQVIQTSRKHCGKRRNCLLRAISAFPTVFKRLVFYGRQKVWLYGNGLTKEAFQWKLLINRSYRLRILWSFLLVFALYHTIPKKMKAYENFMEKWENACKQVSLFLTKFASLSKTNFDLYKYFPFIFVICKCSQFVHVLWYLISLPHNHNF